MTGAERGHAATTGAGGQALTKALDAARTTRILPGDPSRSKRPQLFFTWATMTRTDLPSSRYAHHNSLLCAVGEALNAFLSKPTVGPYSARSMLTDDPQPMPATSFLRISGTRNASTLVHTTGLLPQSCQQPCPLATPPGLRPSAPNFPAPAATNPSL